MSERLPYEEKLQQQWHDLPLPDENMAWADMKRRLDDDDDDGVVVAWWRRGCGLWVLLAVVLLALGWWLLEPQQWFSNRSADPQKVSVQQETPNNKPVNDDTISVSTKKPGAVQPGNTPLSPGNDSVTDPAPANETATINQTKPAEREKTNPSVTTTSQASIDVTPGKTTRRKPTNNKSRPQKQQVSIAAPVNNLPDVAVNTNKPVATDKPVTTDKNDTDSLPAQPVADKKTNSDSLSKKQPADSSDVVKKDSTAVKPDVAKKKDKEKKPVFFSGGIALQQQIPIAGQTASPYNAVGRKGSLRDYIPSVYLRFNKKDRWFFQGEFRYGAPQLTKNILYEQVSKPDTFGGTPITVTNSSRVTKTFYHQLPVTFQHYVLPGWSVGGGFVWNKFNGAISEQSENWRNSVTQNDTVVDFKIVKIKGDSAHAFSKSYFQAVFETQYQWRRFSLGARYAFGLQPYIRFTLPGALPREEKNSSLQIFLRYELWRSKEK